MEPIEELERVFAHNRQFTLQTVKGMTKEDLAWRPSPVANPGGFILWHLARNEDLWMHRFISRGAQVHETAGFDKRFNLTIPKGESAWVTAGFGWTAEQVGAFPAFEPALLIEYLEAVRADLLSYLRGLKLTDLETKPRPDRSPNTVGWVMRQMAMHEAYHIGQLDYCRGLKAGKVL